MPKVLVIAQCKDATKWEQGFRTHGELFKSMGVTKPISYGAGKDNHFAVCSEPSDVAVYMKVLESTETAAAMAQPPAASVLSNIVRRVIWVQSYTGLALLLTLADNQSCETHASNRVVFDCCFAGIPGPIGILAVRRMAFLQWRPRRESFLNS